MDRRRARAGATARTVVQAATPAVTVPADLLVQDAEQRFRQDPDLRGLVVRRAEGSVHLLARAHLDAVLAGRYGYGRALHSRRTVSDILTGDTLLLPADMTLRAAAETVLRRDPSSRYDDVVVAGPADGFGLLPVTVLFEDLSRTFSALALSDGLTGLPNRSLLEQRIMDVPVQPGTALLFVDLDGFKDVNDTHGHRLGDELLCSFADRLRECVRPDDLVVRLGGDEFAVLLEKVTPEEARVVADRVVQQAGLPFVLASTEVRVGASVGLAMHEVPLHPDSVVDVDLLLRCADAAMYQAKREGKGRRVIRAVGDDEPEQPPDLPARLRSAIDRGWVVPYYQPKTDLRSGATVGFEALARWIEPGLGVVPPDVFIPIAEGSGLIGRLGAHVLDLASATARDWEQRGHRWDVAVNLSPIQLAEPAVLLAVVQAALERHDLGPERLWLELTESAAMSDLGEGVAALSELRSWGVRIALDDFGTGYSSLSALRDLPLDALKIDRSFVQRSCDPTGERLLRMVVDTAHDIGLIAIAEGVETESQLSALRALGCDQAQGFLLGTPAPHAVSARGLISWQETPAATA